MVIDEPHVKLLQRKDLAKSLFIKTAALQSPSRSPLIALPGSQRGDFSECRPSLSRSPNPVTEQTLTPPARPLPQSTEGTEMGAGLLESATRDTRVQTHVQTQAHRCANPPAEGLRSRGSALWWCELRHSHGGATAPHRWRPRGPGHRWRKSSPRRVSHTGKEDI